MSYHAVISIAFNSQGMRHCSSSWETTFKGLRRETFSGVLAIEVICLGSKQSICLTFPKSLLKLLQALSPLESFGYHINILLFTERWFEIEEKSGIAKEHTEVRPSLLFSSASLCCLFNGSFLLSYPLFTLPPPPHFVACWLNPIFIRFACFLADSNCWHRQFQETLTFDEKDQGKTFENKFLTKELLRRCRLLLGP